jgi:hypothetical protein
VIDFVAERPGVSRRRLSARTRLRRDLRLYGDLAVQFFEDYRERFDVDLTAFDFRRYFPVESEIIGPYPVAVFPWLWCRRQQKPDITIRDLADAAEAGHWPG